MSYILDALKKSEQERKKGTVPGLGTIQGLPGGRFGDNGLRRYYLPATLVVLIALAALTWLFRHEPTPAPPPQTVAPAASAAAPAAAPVAAATAPAAPTTPATTPAIPAVSVPPPEPQAALAERPERRDRSDRGAHKTSPAASQKPLPRPPTLSAAAKVSAPTVADAAVKEASPERAPTPEATPAPAMENIPSPTTPVMEKAAGEPPPGDSPDQEAEVVVKPEELPIVPLAELPGEFKAEMPEVKIGIHFFSDDPASRRAGVNGRLLREGQLVEKDLLLKEITREGAVLAFKGRRFSLAVFPR